VPGAYLAAILASAAGVAATDARWRLAAWHAPGRTAAAVGIGTAFFLAWDAVGIATGVFVKGASPLLLGIDIAPQLPLEEPFFLAFLSYLALVLWAGAARMLRRRTRSDAGPAAASRTEAP
jgi:lycopene cyclase domain-containing protein